MKVLHITPTLSISNIPELNTRTSGLGYMVNDIMESEKNLGIEVSVLVSHMRVNNEIVSNGIFILKNPLQTIFKGLFYSRVAIGLMLLSKYGRNIKSIVHILYFVFLSGYLYKILKYKSYDLVHIHGCDYFDSLVIEICKKLQIRYLVTLHGLNILGAHTVSLIEEKYEEDFIRSMSDSFMTFVSTGTMMRAVNHLKINPRNFFVISNSYHMLPSKGHVDIRKKYSLPIHSKIILYVGNISTHKNQLGFINAFSRLEQQIVDNVYVLFVGRDNLPHPFEEVIRESVFAEHFVNCGFVDKNKIPDYYAQADFVALVSKSEGFGLSVIEGFAYGIPSLVVSSMDALNDFQSDDALIVAKDLKSESIAEGIEKLLQKKWDKEKILKHSSQFTMAAMGGKYVSIYNKILNESK